MNPCIRPLPLERIRKEDTALLVIDMERDFVDAGAVQETPGGRAIAVAKEMVVEERGAFRATVRLDGAFEGRAPLLFFARLHFFAGHATVRVALTIRNPRRAMHPGGTWELGDAGSVLVEDLSWELAAASARSVAWSSEPGAPLEAAGEGHAAELPAPDAGKPHAADGRL